MTLLSTRPKSKPKSVFQDSSLQTIIASHENVGRQKQKALSLACLAIGALAGGLGLRLVNLQLLNGQQWRERADANRIRLIARQPERGRVLDAKGRELIGSKLSHSVFLWPAAKSNPQEWDATLKYLSKIIKKPTSKLKERLGILAPASIDRIRVGRNLTPAQVTAIEEAGPILRGVEVDAETTRVYPHGQAAAHILGYTGEISEDEYQRLRGNDYKRGDVNGKLGIEASLEHLLRGQRGGKTVEVDAAGKVVQVIGEKASRMGKELQLTIDIELQKEVEKVLGKRKGAIVVMNPNNGEVLAMASWPTFDPNMFSKERITQKEWDALQKLPHPFVNRAVQAFPPASTFKIVTTAAAIESGKWPADTVLQTFPSLTFGGTRFGEWNHAGFGPLGFAGALMHSSDTFFYQIAGRIHGDTFTEWMHKFGVGERTGVALPDEAAGLLPQAKWKQKEFGEEWLLGDSINMSIGQGFVTASPLQIAAMFAVPANGGYRVRPHILKNKQHREYRKPMNLRPETLKVIREGLRAVVTRTTGEALDVSYLPSVSGKSGTSEDLGDGSDTWFAAYAPTAKPEIVVTAFAERSGGSGGKVGGPMVRDVMAAYFRLKHQAPKKPIARR
ncbi:penicillin-binding protein 2 [filamentous cyanobacterium LEGE 11480]|uniref:Penicillin-binding protein 2 n=1 Tax=Romeriopsis navalis LEGE 11480 TaxID=2777977 RepID=A0A928VM47_9CYAN|nr:penicillin-binding protein 2 [Romeriopsis navalis]MBE9030162.1 penicillin-binding protein 2 [Romeriopsis navalis LEGE 11480]